MNTFDLGPLTFVRALAVNLDPMPESKHRIQYRILDPNIERSNRGVYFIAANDIPKYCGKYSKTFRKRWLYHQFGFIYHFKKDRIFTEINNGSSISVFAQEEEILRKQLASNTPEWIDITSIEGKLLRDYEFPWNSIRA